MTIQRWPRDQVERVSFSPYSLIGFIDTFLTANLSEAEKKAKKKAKKAAQKVLDDSKKGEHRLYRGVTYRSRCHTSRWIQHQRG